MAEPLDFDSLSLATRSYNDLESALFAAEQRLDSFADVREGSDGQLRGYGLGTFYPASQAQGDLIKHLRSLLERQSNAMFEIVKSSDYRRWVLETRGVGMQQAARLLGATGDPYHAERVTKVQGVITAIDAGPRTKREFLSYCGYGVAVDGRAARRTRGQRIMWNPEAKTRAFLIAQSAVRVRGGGPLRDVYDLTKTRELQRVELGHAHNRALRKVAKTMLGDLFDFAKDLC